MSALIKIAAADISLSEIVFFRNLPSAIALYAFARLHGLSVGTKHRRLHAYRSLVGITGMALGFYAIAHLPLATATTLEYTAPLFMMIWLIVFIRRPTTFGRAATMVIGFLGVLLLLQPTLQADQSIPFLAGLTTGACAAIAYRMVWRLGQVGEPAWRIVFVYSSSGALAALFTMPFAGPSNYTLRSLSALVGVGIVGMCAQLAMTRAFRVGSTTLLATLQYSTVVFSAFYGILFWGDRPSPVGTVGLLLIVVSGVFAARSMSRRRNPVASADI
jgi:S-adenosylmethionine uptake transporter